MPRFESLVWSASHEPSGSAWRGGCAVGGGYWGRPPARLHDATHPGNLLLGASFIPRRRAGLSSDLSSPFNMPFVLKCGRLSFVCPAALPGLDSKCLFHPLTLIHCLRSDQSLPVAVGFTCSLFHGSFKTPGVRRTSMSQCRVELPL